MQASKAGLFVKHKNKWRGLQQKPCQLTLG